MADDAGHCNDANYVGFEVAVPAFPGQENGNTCARQVQNLKEECVGTFDWGRFSEDLYAGTTGTVSPADTFDGGDYVQVRTNREFDNEKGVRYKNVTNHGYILSIYSAAEIRPTRGGGE